MVVWSVATSALLLSHVGRHRSPSGTHLQVPRRHSDAVSTLGPITSFISPLAASGCLDKSQLGRAARIFQSLSVVSYCPPTCSRAQRLDWSLQARALQHCLSSTDHSAGGVVIHCGGQRALLMRLSSAIWGFSTRPAWLTVKLCPYLAAWRRWIQETRPPLPAAVFRSATRVPGTWAHWCRSLLVHHSCWLPEPSGVGPGSTSSTLRRWFARGVAPALHRAWRQRLVLGLSALHTVRFDCSSSDFTLNHMIYGRGVDPADARTVGSCPTRS